MQCWSRPRSRCLGNTALSAAISDAHEQLLPSSSSNKDGVIACHGRAALGASDALDFELPFTSKVLLLAAYICSRNKPALDRRLFDPSSRAGRRRGTMASDRQVR